MMTFNVRVPSSQEMDMLEPYDITEDGVWNPKTYIEDTEIFFNNPYLDDDDDSADLDQDILENDTAALSSQSQTPDDTAPVTNNDVDEPEDQKSLLSSSASISSTQDELILHPINNDQEQDSDGHNDPNNDHDNDYDPKMTLKDQSLSKKYMDMQFT